MSMLTGFTGLTASADGPTSEAGYSGVQPPPWSYYGTMDVIEEAPQLRWPASIATYHRMASDSQIDSLFKSVSFPLRRWRWGISATGARDEVVQRIADALNLPVLGTDDEPRRVGFNHDDFLRHSLLALRYGHMFHEIVGHVGDDGQWVMDNLAPRMPQSVQQVIVQNNGDFGGIVQWGTRGFIQSRLPAPLANGTPIPGDFVVPDVWNREGANWLGISALRPLYKHWIIKDRVMRIDAMRHERFGLGIPKARAPHGASEEVVSEYGKLAMAVQASPAGGIGLPGAKSGETAADVWVEGARGTLPDTIATLRYHDEAMARDFLAMFMQLGSTATGSRALGASFVDFFDLSLDAIGRWYIDTTNTYAVDRMTRWMFGPDEQAPSIGYERQEDPMLSVADFVDLIASGTLTVDDELEGWARDHWGLPDRDPNAPVRTVSLPAPVPKLPSPSTDNAPVIATRRRPQRAARAASSQTLNEPTIGHREPTPLEVRAATNFTAMQATWQTATRALVAAWAAVRAAQVAQLAGAAADALTEGSVADVAALSADVAGGDLIAAHMLSVYQAAVAAAVAEATGQGATVRAPSADTARIRAHAEAVAGLLARTLADAAVSQALQRYATGTAERAAIEQGIADHLNALSDSFLNDRLGGALTSAQNMARADVFDQMPDTATSFYASELLDQNTCDPCSSVDGTQYDTLDDAMGDYSGTGYNDCDGGDRCRGTIIAVADEATSAA